MEYVSLGSFFYVYLCSSSNTQPTAAEVVPEEAASEGEEGACVMDTESESGEWSGCPLL